jgi:hypothetical protein
MNVTSLTLDNALHGIEELLRDRIGPEIGDPFAAQMARLSCLLLRISANAIDDAAELRVQENAAIRHILGEASAIVEGQMAELLLQAAASTDPGLRLSVLDSENHRLRTLLVDCHAALEAEPSEAASRLVRRIWQLLDNFEARRAPRE